MPTGYTADIKDGISFERFVMNCARAFGACVTLRDEAGGGEKIPDEFFPDEYHLNALTKAKAELSTVQSMTDEECERNACKDFDDAEALRFMRLQEIEQQRQAYESMLAKTQAWVPPTSDHTGLRDFMLEQITKSIDFDCGTDYYDTPTEKKTGQEWRASKIADLNKGIGYHAEKHADEVKRAADRTAWVRALRASLEDNP